MVRHAVRRRVFEVLFAARVLALTGAPTLGAGGLLPPVDYSGRDLTEPAQRAVIVHAGDRESLFLFVDYQGGARSLAWIIPCPSRPDVRATSPTVFKEAADYYHHLEMLAWGRNKPRPGDGAAGGGADMAPERNVTIHEIKQVGPYEIAILSATTGESLYAWLEKHDYGVPQRAAPVLQDYIGKDWFFAAVKIRVMPRLLQTLPPVVLRFQTDAPIYPLRISAINSGVTDIHVYCFRERTARAPAERDESLALQDDFQALCPVLSHEVAGVAWHKVQVTRISDTLVPQVMRRLDDGVHPHQAFHPFLCLARTVGIVEAFMSSDDEESKWAAEHLEYYAQAKPRPGDFAPEHLAALRDTGKRLGPLLRTMLLAHIGAVVEPGRRRPVDYLRDDWASRATGVSDLNLEGAVILLVRTCEPDDEQVLAVLTRATRAAGGGTFWGDALRDLNTPASRRALAAIAEGKADVGAAFRLIGSLEGNAIAPEEEPTACRELLPLLARGIAAGDAFRRGMTLLRAYTGQDFGQDWNRWKTWLEQNTRLPKLRLEPPATGSRETAAK